MEDEAASLAPDETTPKDQADGEGQDDSDKPESAAKSDDMDIIVQSGSQRAIENLLRVYYEPLELWFLRMSIEKVSKSYPLPWNQISISAHDCDIADIRHTASTPPRYPPNPTSRQSSTTRSTSSSWLSIASCPADPSRRSSRCG